MNKFDEYYAKYTSSQKRGLLNLKSEISKEGLYLIAASQFNGGTSNCGSVGHWAKDQIDDSQDAKNLLTLHRNAVQFLGDDIAVQAISACLDSFEQLRDLDPDDDDEIPDFMSMKYDYSITMEKNELANIIGHAKGIGADYFTIRLQQYSGDEHINRILFQIKGFKGEQHYEFSLAVLRQPPLPVRWLS